MVLCTFHCLSLTFSSHSSSVFCFDLKKKKKTLWQMTMLKKILLPFVGVYISLEQQVLWLDKSCVIEWADLNYLRILSTRVGNISFFFYIIKLWLETIFLRPSNNTFCNLWAQNIKQNIMNRMAIFFFGWRFTLFAYLTIFKILSDLLIFVLEFLHGHSNSFRL